MEARGALLGSRPGLGYRRSQLLPEKGGEARKQGGSLASTWQTAFVTL